jgi:hypothetical protein
MNISINSLKSKHNLRGKVFSVALALCVLTLAGAANVEAKSKKKDKTPATNVFTAPVEIEPGVPLFVNREGTPLKPHDITADFAQNPNLDTIRKLPSLTNDQRKEINRLENDARAQRAALQDEVKTVQEKLNTKKASPQFSKVTGKKDHIILANAPRTASPPSDMSMEMQDVSMEQIGAPMMEEVTEDSLKAKIENSNLIIKGKNVALWQSVMAVLTDKQREELDKMRRGQLMITVAAGSADLSAKPPATTGSSAPKGPVGELVGLDKTVLKKILSNSPGASVYNTLRSF